MTVFAVVTVAVVTVAFLGVWFDLERVCARSGGSSAEAMSPPPGAES